ADRRRRHPGGLLRARSARRGRPPLRRGRGHHAGRGRRGIAGISHHGLVHGDGEVDRHPVDNRNRVLVIVEVDTTSPTPPYEQIRAQVARMIGTGVLPAETQLPPIRQLAADLGLAANTVVHPQRTLSLAEINSALTDAARAYVTVARQLGVDDDVAAAAVRAELKRR